MNEMVSQHKSDAAQDLFRRVKYQLESVSLGRNDPDLLKREYKFMFVRTFISNKLLPCHAVPYVDVYVYTARPDLN